MPLSYLLVVMSQAENNIICKWFPNDLHAARKTILVESHRD